MHFCRRLCSFGGMCRDKGEQRNRKKANRFMYISIIYKKKKLKEKSAKDWITRFAHLQRCAQMKTNNTCVPKSLPPAWLTYKHGSAKLRPMAQSVLLLWLISFSETVATLSYCAATVITYTYKNMHVNTSKSLSWFIDNTEPAIKSVNVSQPDIQ